MQDQTTNADEPAARMGDAAELQTALEADRPGRSLWYWLSWLIAAAILVALIVVLAWIF